MNRIRPSIWTRKNRRFTISAPITVTSHISTICLPTPILCWHAASPSTSSPLICAEGLRTFRLDLLPGNWFVPYLAFDHDSGSGTGATTFVTDTNRISCSEHPGGSDQPLSRRRSPGVAPVSRHARARRDHLQERSNIFQSPGPNNFGNVLTPSFGQTTDLTDLLAAYGVRGTSIYSKALFTANATSWMDVYGQFLYSQPDTTVSYRQSDTGNLFLQNQVLFYTSQQYLVSAAAKLPHTTGTFGAEIRPLRRVRIVESWLTDRLHNAGSATSSQTLTSIGTSQQMAALLSSSLVTNYNQEEIMVFYDVTSKLTFAGVIVTFGARRVTRLPLEGLAGPEKGRLRRNVGIGGITFRSTQKLSITGETEGASSGGAYFRTSLYDYQKIRAQARYQVVGSLSLSADFTLLNNQNPSAWSHYNFLAHQESLSFLWVPQGGKNWGFQGSYSRSTVYSDIAYLEPEVLTPKQSVYRDNAHTATALFSANLPRYSGLTPKFSAGGSLFISSGSRPTSYFLPLAKLVVPVSKKFSWFAEWSYYGYGEAFYLYEGFRTHMVTTGLRVSR